MGRVRRHLVEGNYAKRIRIGGAVYAATVIEYLVTEVLELAGKEAKVVDRIRITPRHIMYGIRKDEELNSFMKDITIPFSGVVYSDSNEKVE